MGSLRSEDERPRPQAFQDAVRAALKKVVDKIINNHDNGTFSFFKKQALMYGGLTESECNASVEDLFDKLELSEDGNPKLAATLLFDPEPQGFTEGAAVQIGMFEGPDILFQDYLKCPLFTMPDRIVDLLFTKYMKAPITYEGLHRKENAPYPREAIREAVLNALTHSDYGDKVAIQIRVFADRITIYNSRSPPNGWTVETLLSSHRSYPGNPTMAQIFHRAGMVEKFGRGIEKIMDQYKGRDAKAPEFRFDGSEFSVTLFDENYGKDHEFESGEDSPENIISKGLSVNESAIYDMISKSVYSNAVDASNSLGISYSSVNRAISSLRDKGLIERIGPNKSGVWIIKK